MTQSERAADWIVGIDVGGTFTDIIALNRKTGETRDGKVLSTLQQEEGVLLSIEAIGVEVPDVAEIVHGHTVGINALLSRTGERTGLIATRSALGSLCCSPMRDARWRVHPRVVTALSKV